MARVNIELKARDPDPSETAARCLALGASDQGVLAQRDTYFASRRGRLKLRMEEGALGGELIAYGRPDAREVSESRYVLAPVAAADELAEALDAALGTVVVVSKRRRLFLWEGVRIHLDEVDGLGAFIEFEAVLPEAGDLATARAKVARLRTELGIADDALVPVGYADLLIDGQQALLRAADEAMRNAYAPYSEFKVGAAVRGASGAIYAGANVENVAYPQGQCAEASALGALVDRRRDGDHGRRGSRRARSSSARRAEAAGSGCPSSATPRRRCTSGARRADRPWASCCPARSTAGRCA